EGSDAHATEFLYDEWGGEFRIAKKTAKRIYYVKEADFGSAQIGFVSRHCVIDDWPGRRTWHDWQDFKDKFQPRKRRKFARKPLPPEFWGELAEEIDLAQLKKMMAAAHPDKGGSSAAFIEARQRYVAARRRASVGAS